MKKLSPFSSDKREEKGKRLACTNGHKSSSTVYDGVYLCNWEFCFQVNDWTRVYGSMPVGILTSNQCI